ncbi:uncharacterized protein N7477_006364 [Penicillium maclennaniae]|uniref:uncharacterized protein n=1 Tax=Penicillium maclennaniae TaxID=1343394 RepID=UPI002541C0D1|nr:uncharacterized protein N7477_006364 [Penicillium maclennaniae]KAJ5667794.1 hypothetical protein N7477_006364 [Penicillium maclennaniae]
MVFAHHSWAPWTGGMISTEQPENNRKEYDVCQFNILGTDGCMALHMSHTDLDSLLDHLSLLHGDIKHEDETHWVPVKPAQCEAGEGEGEKQDKSIQMKQHKKGHARIQRSSTLALVALAQGHLHAAARIVGTRPFPIVGDLAEFNHETGIISPALVAGSFVHVLPRLRSRELEPSNAVTAACACAHLIVSALNGLIGNAESRHVRRETEATRAIGAPEERSIPAFTSRGKQVYREAGMVQGLLYSGIIEYLIMNRDHITELQESLTEAGTTFASLLATLPAAFHAPPALAILGPLTETLIRPFIKKLVESVIPKSYEGGFYKATLSAAETTLELPDVPSDASEEFARGINLAMSMAVNGYGAYKTMIEKYRETCKISLVREAFIAMRSYIH